MVFFKKQLIKSLNFVVVVTALLQFIAEPAFCSAEKCEDIFTEISRTKIGNPLSTLVDVQSVRFSEDPLFKNVGKAKTKRYQQALDKLLFMAANTINENANEKLSLEKGEINLAYKMPEGSSFQFQYAIDKSNGPMRFVLKEIRFYKYNLDDTKITDKPVDEELEHLHVSSLVLAKLKTQGPTRFTPVEKENIADLLPTFEEKLESQLLNSEGDFLSEVDLQSVIELKNKPVNEFDSASKNTVDKPWSVTDIKIPIVLTGDLLNVFIEKSELYQLLDREIIKSKLNSSSFWQLNMLGHKSKVNEMIGKVYFKQAIKQATFSLPFALFTLYLISQLSEIQKDLETLVDPEPVLVSQEISDLLSEIFDRTDGELEWHNSKLYRRLKDEIKINLSQNISSQIETTERLVNYYISKEPDKSKIAFLKSDENLTHLVKVNSDSISDKLNANSHLENLILYFPSKQALIIITRSYSRIDPSKMTFESHVVVTEKKSPLLYKGLVNTLFPIPKPKSSSSNAATAPTHK